MQDIEAEAAHEPSFAAARHSRERLSPVERLRAWLLFSTVGNPVLVKEFRTRMRGSRAYWLLLAYTLLLAGVVALMYFSHEVNQAQQSGGNFVAGAEGARDLGRSIYYFCFIAQAIMVALITPALTSGAVTIEREQRSYELLVTTPLQPSDIIRGKMTAAVAFVVLLLTVSLPLASLSFLVGGVSPAEIFFSYLILALAAFVYGSIGIFWSATLRTTAVSTVVTYLTVIGFFILTLMPGMIALSGPGSSGTGAVPEFPFQSLNPIAASFRAVQPENLFALTIPSWTYAAVLNLLLGTLIAVAAMGRLEHFDPPRPVWLRTIATGFWCAFLLAVFGPILGGVMKTWSSLAVGTPVREVTGGFITAILALVVLIAPILNTGDLVIRRGESALGRYLRGLLPDRMWSSDLSNGVPLTVAWTLFGLALLPVAAQFIGRLTMLPGAVFIPGSILCFCVLAGVIGFGNLLSVTLPSRWAACILTYLMAVVLMLLPYFTVIPWYQAANRPKDAGLLWQLLYLAPFDGLVELMNPGSFWTDHPTMLFGRTPPWLITAPLYLALGLLCFLISAARIAQVGRQLSRRDAPAGEISPAARQPQ